MARPYSITVPEGYVTVEEAAVDRCCSPALIRYYIDRQYYDTKSADILKVGQRWFVRKEVGFYRSVEREDCTNEAPEGFMSLWEYAQMHKIDAYNMLDAFNLIQEKFAREGHVQFRNKTPFIRRGAPAPMIKATANAMAAMVLITQQIEGASLFWNAHLADAPPTVITSSPAPAAKRSFKERHPVVYFGYKIGQPIAYMGLQILTLIRR